MCNYIVTYAFSNVAPEATQEEDYFFTFISNKVENNFLAVKLAKVLHDLQIVLSSNYTSIQHSSTINWLFSHIRKGYEKVLFQQTYFFEAINRIFPILSDDQMLFLKDKSDLRIERIFA